MHRELKPGHMWIWADDPNGELENILKAGAKAFESKFGQRPNLCKLNPAYVGEPQTVNGIELVPMVSVLQWDFWFGVKSNQEGKIQCNTTS